MTIDMVKENEYIIIIDNHYCKGCGICAEFCPKGVLEIVNELAYSSSSKECSGCKLCEDRCPDLAIEVKKR